MVKDYGNIPGLYSAGLYINGLVAEAALEKTGGKTDDREAFIKALRGVSLVDTPRGPFTFDHLGNVVGSFYIRRCERKGDKLVNTRAADLRQIRCVVGRHQRRPELLDDPPAQVLEDPLEPAHLLVAEREVVRDGDDALELHLLRRVVRQRVHVLRLGPLLPHEVRIGPALRHVLGSGQAQDWHLGLRGVVADGEQLERRERPKIMSTWSRSTSSCVFVLVPAGLPPV